MTELILDLRDALDDGDDHRAAFLLEQLFDRADRRRHRPWRRRGRQRLLLRRGPDTRRPGRGLERLEAGPPPTRADW